MYIRTFNILLFSLVHTPVCSPTNPLLARALHNVGSSIGCSVICYVVIGGGGGGCGDWGGGGCGDQGRGAV